MANFRPLQPAPMDQDPPPHPQSRPLLAQKPKRTVTLGACVACRKRKSKCDGNRPNCTCCIQKDTECVYELGPNEKPSQAMKRKNEEMQGELSNLRQLYDFLRLRPEEEAMEILKRIRAPPPDTSPAQRIQELADFVRHGDLFQPQQSQYSPPMYHRDHGQITLPSLRIALDSPSSLDSHNLPFPDILCMGHDGPASQRRRFNSEANISARSGSQISHPPPAFLEGIVHRHSNILLSESPTDARLSTVTKWTTVTDDTDLLISILSAWTEREYSFYHYLDRDAFLDDMASGRTIFCSELLVNALLASACFHHSATVDRHKPFAEISMTTKFYQEAQRLWQLEDGKDSITKLHAGICLYLVLGKHGRDRIGHAYLLESCQIGRNLGLFDSTSSSNQQRPVGVPEGEWIKVFTVTAWALFNFQMQMSSVYSIPVIIHSPPSLPLPYNDQPERESLFRSECAKFVIVLACHAARRAVDDFDKTCIPKRGVVDSCFDRLTDWWNRRDASLDPRHAPSKQNLLCIMMYHVEIINLYRPILQCAPIGDWTQSDLEHARQITSSSLQSLRSLLLLQEQRHGWSDAITLILHPITIAGFGSLDEILISNDDPSSNLRENDESYQGLLICLRALEQLSNYSYFAQPLFRLLVQKCQSQELHIPAGMQTALHYYTSEEWTKEASLMVSSQYIADMRKSVCDAEASRMDATISSWGRLSLDEAGKGKARASQGK